MGLHDHGQEAPCMKGKIVKKPLLLTLLRAPLHMFVSKFAPSGSSSGQLKRDGPGVVEISWTLKTLREAC